MYQKVVMDHVLATTGLCNDKVYLEICCCSVAKSWPALCDQMDCKDIQPVHPKGDQSWVFTGKTDVEAETPVLWPPEAKG